MWYVEEACIVVLLSVYIHLDTQQTVAYQISVMVPTFRENVDATVVCKVNNSELNAVNCPFSVLPITRLRIILSDDPPSTPLLTGTDICVFSSFLTCTHGPPVSALECGCYHDGGDIYTVNVTVRADRAVHENKIIDCRPDCVNLNFQYGLVNTITGVPIVFADTQQTAAYNISVMVPTFTENEVATVVCKVNNSELNAVNCPFSVLPITRLRIFLSDDPPSTPFLTGTDMCVFSSFFTCTHDPPVSALECGCYHDGGDIYTVNVTVRADRALHENKIIDCRPDCVNLNFQYGLVNTFTGVPIVFEERMPLYEKLQTHDKGSVSHYDRIQQASNFKVMVN